MKVLNTPKPNQRNKMQEQLSSSRKMKWKSSNFTIKWLKCSKISRDCKKKHDFFYLHFFIIYFLLWNIMESFPTLRNSPFRYTLSLVPSLTICSKYWVYAVVLCFVQIYFTENNREFVFHCKSLRSHRKNNYLLFPH